MKSLYLLPLLLILTSCTNSGDDKKTLTHYNFEPTNEYFLTSELREISGLTFLNGKLYANNDEKGIVYVLDESGRIDHQFFPGVRPLKKDFEGIASDGKFIYLVTSAGVLYKINYTDTADISYEEIKTPLNPDYDIEGLCFDRESNTLLMVCKSYPHKEERNVRAVFTFDIESGRLINKPRFIISISELKEKFGISDFSPSGIEKHPDGNFYILSSNQKAVAVYNAKGELLEAAKLPSKHMQPEGITFLTDNSMIISDEGGKDDAELTIYRFTSKNK